MALARHDGAFLDLGIALENHFMMLGVDSGTIVGNIRDKLFVLHLYFNFDPFLAMMQGIFNEISDNLPEFDLILLHFGHGYLGVDIPKNTGFR